MDIQPKLTLEGNENNSDHVPISTQPDSGTTPLYCVVCGDRSNGKHYGVISCEGCRGFFKRAIYNQHRIRFPYCKANQNCVITKQDRNRCQYCRFKKCIDCGMKNDTPELPDRSHGVSLKKSSFKKITPRSPSVISYPMPVQCLNTDLLNTDLLNTDSSSTECKCDEYEGPILDDEHVPFTPQIHESNPPHMDIHYICETGSKLLILSLYWTKNIPAFQHLSSEAQIGILQAYWAELFVLALAQCSEPLSIPSILSTLFSIVQAKPETESQILEDHIIKLQDFVDTMSTLQVSNHEYAYLKAISLFSTDKLNGLDREHIEQLQVKSFQALSIYIGDEDRLARLLLRLPTLRSIDPKILEDLFFCDLLNEVKVDSVIPHILKMKSNEETECT